MHPLFWSSTILQLALHSSHPPLTSVLYYADGENGEKSVRKPRFPQESGEKNNYERKSQRTERGRGRGENLGLEEYLKLAVERK